MADRSYRIFTVIDVAGDDLPNSSVMADLVYDQIEKMSMVGCQVQDISAYPDSINEDVSPPTSIQASLDLMQSYLTHVREGFEEGDYTKAADEGLRQIESGIAYLKGCLSGIKAGKNEAACSTPEIRAITRENLAEAPEPILHLIAHRMGLSDCAGMDKEALVQWITNKLDETGPKPN